MRKAGAHTAIETDDVAHFLHCWVVSKATKQVFSYCQKFVAMNGTFMKAHHKLVLLAVIAVDGNGETLPIAWSLIQVENTLNWDWFLHGIRPFFDGLKAEDAVIISDHQKGLKNAVKRNFLQAIHSHYSQHIVENLGLKFLKKCVLLFRQAVVAKFRGLFDDIMRKIKDESAVCALYIQGIPKERWAKHTFPHPQYGFTTSNIAESTNGHWLETYKKPALKLLASVWTGVMQKIYD